MEVQLGKVPTTEERDAIHLACIPCVAGHALRPADRVTLVDGAAVMTTGKAVGIVDPFRSDAILRGTKFWLCLLPGTVVGMRHHWQHVDFDDDGFAKPAESDRKIAAKVWLEEQAENLEMEFSDLVDSELVDGGFILKSEDARDHWYEIRDEFWEKLETYLGHAIPEDNRGGFTCSC